MSSVAPYDREGGGSMDQKYARALPAPYPRNRVASSAAPPHGGPVRGVIGTFGGYPSPATGGTSVSAHLIEERVNRYYSSEATTERDGEGRLKLARARILWSLAGLFMVSMALVAAGEVVAGVPAGAEATALIPLVAAAVILPAILAQLARFMLEPAEELAQAGDQLQGLYNRARSDALLDPLTSLGNHRAFQEELARQIEEARRHNYPLSLALMDLDDLKRVNDELGHAGGDGILASMGRLISTSVRAADRGFRVGGDEFALLLPHTDGEEAHAIVRRLLANSLDGETVRPGMPAFSFSAGISAFPELSPDSGRLRRNADAALDWSKRHGRTDVQVFDPERHGALDDTRSTPELAAAVAEVARDHALAAVFQPIYDLQTGEPIGFEGLVRPAESGGFRDAESLFVAAEVTDRTVELDMACVEVVAASAPREITTQYLSINVSPRTLETEQFRVSDLLTRLAPHGIKPGQIVLELTEREAIQDLERLRTNLQACRAAGMRIAADDVGAGHAGLRLLSEVGFDIVKVDLSLVQGGVLRDSTLAVLQALRDLTDRGHMVLVAEGIETREQLEVVRSLGFAAGQGYLLGPPYPLVSMEPIDLELLAANPFGSLYAA
jgi:diguanylate cyclase (GGDEF)-like protein